MLLFLSSYRGLYAAQHKALGIGRQETPMYPVWWHATLISQPTKSLASHDELDIASIVPWLHYCFLGMVSELLDRTSKPHRVRSSYGLLVGFNGIKAKFGDDGIWQEAYRAQRKSFNLNRGMFARFAACPSIEHATKTLLEIGRYSWMRQSRRFITTATLCIQYTKTELSQLAIIIWCWLQLGNGHYG